ncbi:hypothetical protein [Flavobacterium selenitireducens]|uniref:hypothetical protein n=1 Tax=Flavobacterium selenitireducens TaxID=2722704 RepID=UPI00168B59DA|nr:hypothetical protein [Flavobacterium selenitireducens]MBD3583654.1 hypothetical protein [Flavobacterium selenitireducens]
MNFRNLAYTALVAMSAAFWSCTPNDDADGNGIVSPELDASFTITPVAGSPNRFLLQATGSNDNTLAHYWNTGSGNGGSGLVTSKEIFLPDAGTYTITHTQVGIGGAQYTSSQELEVETSDPVAGNLIRGGKFETAEDIAQWQLFPQSIAGSAWTFANGEATMTGSINWNHQHLYQAIQVEAGHTYKFDMKVKGLGNTMDTYMEWYAGYNPPTGNDYNEGGQILALNTWAGCAIGPFEGLLSEVGCGGDTSEGLKVFPTSGTVYVVLRSASGYASATPFSITIDNVEVRRID